MGLKSAGNYFSFSYILQSAEDGCHLSIPNSRLENTILWVMYAVGFDSQYVLSEYKRQGLCWSDANIVLYLFKCQFQNGQTHSNNSSATADELF